MMISSTTPARQAMMMMYIWMFVSESVDRSFTMLSLSTEPFLTRKLMMYSWSGRRSGEMGSVKSGLKI